MKTGNAFDLKDNEEKSLEASMEPGHEDREYRPRPCSCTRRRWRLNGARS